LIEFGVQNLITAQLLFEAFDHLAHSTAVFVAESPVNVNAAFAVIR
jgi:hypothetical protein